MFVIGRLVHSLGRITEVHKISVVQALAFILVVSAAGGAYALTVDGSLADWGVNLQLVNSNLDSRWNDPIFYLNGVPQTPSRIDPNSFVPVNPSGIDYRVANDDAAPHGGELYDAEAIYVKIVGLDVYFAIVASSGPNGALWNGYGSGRFGPGDLQVTVIKNSVSTVYGIGARPFALSLPQYGGPVGYGPADQRDPASWSSTSNPWGAASQNTSQALVVKAPTWSHIDNPGYPDEPAYFVANPSAYANWNDVFVGYTDAAWAQKWAVGDYYIKDGYGIEEPYGTWIYEGRVPLAMLGIGAGEMASLGFAYTMDCSNDTISSPEPTTIVFLATGLAALAGFTARRRMRKG